MSTEQAARINFDAGVSSMGVPVEGFGLGDFHPWTNVFFVQSTHDIATDGSNGWRPSSPKASIASALASCEAGRGDVIVVGPGHVEAISTAAIIAINKAGVRILGQGFGDYRPTLTFTAAIGNLPFTAAACKMQNFIWTTLGTIDVTAMATITAADVELSDIEVRELNATSQVIDCVVVGAGGHRAKIIRPRFLGQAGDATQTFLSVVAAVDHPVVIDPDLDGYFGTAALENVTAACTNALLARPVIRNRHATTDACVTMHADATGTLFGGKLRTATNDADGFNNAIVFPKGQVYDTEVVNADGEHGARWGTASSAYANSEVPVRFVRKTITFTGAAGLGAIGNVPLFAVTGEVLVDSIMPTIVTTLVGATATLELGVTGKTAHFIAATLATDLAAGDLWIDATPTEVNAVALPAGFTWQVLTDNIVGTVAIAAITAGVIRIDLFYRPLSADGLIVAA